MIKPAHIRYQKQLTALATDTAILNVLEDAAKVCAWWPRQRTWIRRYGRFDPDRDPFATLVFETQNKPQAIFHAEVYQTRPTMRCAGDIVAFDEAVGWLRVMRFPSDRSLSTLASVLTEQGDMTVVRYRPQRRCTIRFEENGQTRFAKVYPKKFLRYERGERFHSTAVALWCAAERGELGFAVAQPDRWDPQARTLWQAKLDGAPAIARLFGRDGNSVALRMGLAAGSLTRSGITLPKIFDGTKQLSASMRCGEELSRRVPRLAAKVCALLEHLVQMHAATKHDPPRPIHGDMDANQWLDDGLRLGLTDFDDFALGDPELDAATFLAELEVEDQPQLPIDQLSEAFLAGYESIAGPLNQRLLTMYIAHKRLFKSLRSARALHPRGDVDAERHLERAYQCISEEDYLETSRSRGMRFDT